LQSAVEKAQQVNLEDLPLMLASWRDLSRFCKVSRAGPKNDKKLCWFNKSCPLPKKSTET